MGSCESYRQVSRYCEIKMRGRDIRGSEGGRKGSRDSGEGHGDEDGNTERVHWVIE